MTIFEKGKIYLAWPMDNTKRLYTVAEQSHCEHCGQETAAANAVNVGNVEVLVKKGYKIEFRDSYPMEEWPHDELGYACDDCCVKYDVEHPSVEA